MTTLTTSLNKYWQYALWLAIFTIGYNLIDGLVSVAFGVQDEALTLFGFGVDSFIEVMSGLGILAMVLRIRRNPATPRSQFERTALRITGAAFYLLAVGLAITAVYNVITGHKPETTLPGLIIAIISIAIMWALVAGKRKVGHALNSSPILADANCTLVCIYMSLVLLAASAVYQLTGFGFVDSLGALGLIYLAHVGFEVKRAFRERACGAFSPPRQHEPSIFRCAKEKNRSRKPPGWNAAAKMRTDRKTSEVFIDGLARPDDRSARPRLTIWPRNQIDLSQRRIL